ncbi:MAG TPA: DnaJ C-terminal domain-containing protein, partial [Phycisphaerales bacterium]|nr:DnaJ C-terminal domain-containing protein [Phycisphaerales bacterium]
MAEPKDYYELLGVSRTASADEIRKAYRKLARTLHPDVNKAPDAAEKFSEVQQAYDILSDDEKRKIYDQFGHAGVGAGRHAGPSARGSRSGGAGGPFRAASPGEHWENVDVSGADFGDLGSLFEQMFGARAPTGRPGAAGRRAASPQRGADIESSLIITFQTAVNGGTEQVRIGSGDQAQTISVKVPPGIESGATLRVKGKGQPSPVGGPAGDLLLTVQVGNHPWFRREGLDLLIDVPVTIVEASLGSKVHVPMMKGSVEIRVPAGTSSGTKLRV